MDPIPEARSLKRALLVGVALPDISLDEARESLEELDHLAHTATLETAGHIFQNRSRIDPAYYIGSGKAAELKTLVQERGADVIVFDNDLSPSQMRNLERLTGTRILDRSLLILDIFAIHARTRTAQIQVERAHLKYLRPRLRQFNPHKERRAGAGSGETWLETDRRRINRREATLHLGLKRIWKQMATSRKNRRDAFKVTLVGYTNSGKSTLMRALSGEQVLVQDQLFATLTSTTRSIGLPHHKKILLTDTIGFIKRLPHHLFDSFKATLEEAVQADLLLHVVDTSHPTYASQVATVNQVLSDLAIQNKPTIVVYNKMDQTPLGRASEIIQACAGNPNVVAISALTGDGLDALREQILSFCREGEITLDLQIPQKEGRLISQIYKQGEILSQDFEANSILMRVRLNRAWVERWQLERFAPA